MAVCIGGTCAPPSAMCRPLHTAGYSIEWQAPFWRAPVVTGARGLPYNSEMRWLAPLFMALVLACGSEAPPQMPAPSSKTGGSERPRAPLADGRWHHFWIIRQARDAVIMGDLPRARALLARIAAGELDEDVPFEWTVWIEEMQDEAMRADRTRHAHDLAQIVAAVASRCGDCHRSVKGRPRTIPLTRLETMAHGRYESRPKQANHGWAAEELWIGMTVPIHQAWVRGSAALTDSPLHAPPPADPESEAARAEASDGPAPNAAATRRLGNKDTGYSEHELFARAMATPSTTRRTPRDPQARLQYGLEDLSRLGEQLHQSGRPLMMARAYGDFIERCASCHEGVRAGGSATQAGPAQVGPVRVARTRP